MTLWYLSPAADFLFYRSFLLFSFSIAPASHPKTKIYYTSSIVFSVSWSYRLGDKFDITFSSYSFLRPARLLLMALNLSLALVFDFRLSLPAQATDIQVNGCLVGHFGDIDHEQTASLVPGINPNLVG